MSQKENIKCFLCQTPRHARICIDILTASVKADLPPGRPTKKIDVNKLVLVDTIDKGQSLSLESESGHFGMVIGSLNMITRKGKNCSLSVRRRQRNP